MQIKCKERGRKERKMNETRNERGIRETLAKRRELSALSRKRNKGER